MTLALTGGAVALGVVLLVPRLRHGLRAIVKPQWDAARINLHDLLTTPRKAAMLFGGNLESQVLYACVLGASLRAYRTSLPLQQLIVIS